MKKRILLIAILFTFIGEISALIVFAQGQPGYTQDTVAVNEVVKSVEKDWGNLQAHSKKTKLNYVVLGKKEEVRYRTKAGLSESIHEAVAHRDTIVDIEKNGTTLGKVIIFNDSEKLFGGQRRTLIWALAAAVFAQCILCIGYLIYIDHSIIKPFCKLKGFAERIADGNLDIPLLMDRHNLFGAFTESFDIMRCELKKARLAEAKANESKKELVAKLSHDIKTPVASIKAASEVGWATAESERQKENYTQIIRKADQIDTLTANLFTATLEELKHLTVTPVDVESREIRAMLENADYLGRAHIPDIPDCVLFADRLRLQQVFDNIFANSYKYADTAIAVLAKKENNSLLVCIEDDGGGVQPEELPLLKEKFKRGGNADGIAGAGLGLHISDCFMKEMHGSLLVENGKRGLKVTVRLAYSGMI